MYIDRIVAAQQSKGLGTLLYEKLFDTAKKQAYKRIGCEFDILPPNVNSARFHKGFGFYPAYTQVLTVGKKRFLCKPLIFRTLYIYKNLIWSLL